MLSFPPSWQILSILRIYIPGSKMSNFFRPYIFFHLFLANLSNLNHRWSLGSRRRRINNVFMFWSFLNLEVVQKNILYLDWSCKIGFSALCIKYRLVIFLHLYDLVLDFFGSNETFSDRMIILDWLTYLDQI